MSKFFTYLYTVSILSTLLVPSSFVFALGSSGPAPTSVCVGSSGPVAKNADGTCPTGSTPKNVTTTTVSPSTNTSGVTCVYQNSEGPAIQPDVNGKCPDGSAVYVNGQASTQSTGNLPPYQPLEPLPGLAQYETGQADFGKLLSMGFKLLIVLAALIAVGSFVYAGISYMVSDVPLVKFSASKRLQAAFLGLAILLGSWIILFTINPQLVTFNGSMSPSSTYYTVPQQAAQNQLQKDAQACTSQGGELKFGFLPSGASASCSQMKKAGQLPSDAVCMSTTSGGTCVLTGAAAQQHKDDQSYQNGTTLLQSLI